MQPYVVHMSRSLLIHQLEVEHLQVQDLSTLQCHCVLCAVYELKGSAFFCFSIFGHGDLHPSLPSCFPVRDKKTWKMELLHKQSIAMSHFSAHIKQELSQHHAFPNPSLGSTNTITMHMMVEEKCFISFLLLFNMGTERAKKQQMVHTTMLCSHKMLL